jgi:hypothetical protein
VAEDRLMADVTKDITAVLEGFLSS